MKKTFHLIPLYDLGAGDSVPSRFRSEARSNRLPPGWEMRKIEMLRRMLVIREAEEHLGKRIGMGEIPTSVIHLSTG